MRLISSFVSLPLSPFTKRLHEGEIARCIAFPSKQFKYRHKFGGVVSREDGPDRRIWVQALILAAVHPAEEALSNNRYPTSSRAAELLCSLTSLWGKKASKRNISPQGSMKYHFIIVNGGHVIFFHHCGGFLDPE